MTEPERKVRTTKYPWKLYAGDKPPEKLPNPFVFLASAEEIGHYGAQDDAEKAAWKYAEENPGKIALPVKIGVTAIVEAVTVKKRQRVNL